MAKKIGAIVSLVIIAVLIVATIIMANINIDYSIKCVKPDVVYIQTKDGQTGVTDEQKDEIVKLISNASEENSLTALFNGELNKKATVKTEKKTFSKPSNFYVRYKYNTEQELKKGDVVVKNADGEVCKYSELVFVVDKDVTEDIKVYVVPDSENPYSYSHYYKLDADFSGLYNYLTEINE